MHARKGAIAGAAAYKGGMATLTKPETAVATDPGAARHAPLSVPAFVVLLAALMSVNALATDIMLPGFPDIAASLGGVEVTRVQAIITAYMFGFGLSQLFAGFLADRFGRRPVLLGGLFIYSAAAVLTAFAGDLTTLLLARFIQGAGSGAPRVVTTAAVRDCYGGRRMARVMSLVMTVFMAAPVLAPSIGQLILFTGSWRWVLGSLAVYGFVLLAICLRSFPETLAPELRRSITLPAIRDALASIFGNRQTVGYALSAGVFLGSLFGFVGSAQQVMVEVFGLGVWFPLAFAVPALSMSASSFLNAGLVERFGMRVLSHAAVAGYSAVSAVMLLLAFMGLLDGWTFIPLMTLAMLFVGLVFANVNALAMEPQAHVAGVASSFVSAVTVVVGASIGFFIGAWFDGTATPLAAGLVGCGFLSLAVIAVTERGRLFVAGPGATH